MKSDKSYTLCIERNKLLKMYIQYNEFKKNIIQTEYYSYEF